MKRLIFLNRFFFPDHSATSQILSDLAFHLAARGREVHVIAGAKLYDDPRARLPATEIIRGVRISRIPATTFGRSAILGRAIDYLYFYRGAWRALTALLRENDIVIAKTDPPLLSVLAAHAVKRRGARLINWLQDLYPEIAVELGVAFMRGAPSTALSSLRDASLKSACVNVAIGERMAERILARGVAPDRVQIIPNWSDDEEIAPVRHEDNPLRREWGLENKFVVGYSGNLGRAHEFDTILGAARRLPDDAHIVFLLIGGGGRMDDLARRVRERRLNSLFRFVPYQDRAVLKYSVGVADVHWISLRPELEGLIVPSKFYGIAAAGRPLIAITSKDGEIATQVRRHGCGLTIEPGHSDALADALIKLSRDVEGRTVMGARARTMLETCFTRRQAFQRWNSLIEEIEKSDQPTSSLLRARKSS